MARSLLKTYARDVAGRAIVGAKVFVYTKDTTDPAPGVFAQSTGGAAITSAVTNAQGELELWFDTWVDYVDLKITDNDDTAVLPALSSGSVSFDEFIEQVPVAPSSDSFSGGGFDPSAKPNFLTGFTSRGPANALITVKPATELSEGLINWVHDSPAGYIIHLEMSSNSAHPAATIGIGTSGSGTGNGLLVAHKNNGNGIHLDIHPTAAGPGKAGFYGQQQNTVISLMKLVQIVPGAQVALEVGADATATGSQKLMVWNVSTGEACNVNASTGKFTWSKDVQFNAETRVGAGTGSPSIIINGAAGQGRDVHFHSNGFGRWTLRGADAAAESGSDAGSDFVIFSRTDAGGFKETPFTINRRAGWVWCAKAIATRTKAGAPVDSDWAVNPPNGTIHVDETNSRLYARVGGVWKYAALT